MRNQCKIRFKNFWGDQMKFKNHNPETVAELLVHLADNEAFASIKQLKSWNKQEIVTILYELSDLLKEESKTGSMLNRAQLRQKDFGFKTTEVISQLSPQEEDVLFKSFKISS